MFIQNLMMRRDGVYFDLLRAFVAAVAISYISLFATQAYAATSGVNLAVNVQTALSFSVSSAGFAASQQNITPGTPLMATTSLNVLTNDAAGWTVALSGDNKNSTNSNLQQGIAPATSTQIADQTEWVPGAATTTSGTGTSTIASLANSGNVLAFRVAQATSTNGSAFYAPYWWGNADNYLTSSAQTGYAGIASSTVLRVIGNAGAGSYSASAHVNDVQYYLNVAATQKTGAYTAALTYTATGN